MAYWEEDVRRTIEIHIGCCPQTSSITWSLLETQNRRLAIPRLADTQSAFELDPQVIPVRLGLGHPTQPHFPALQNGDPKIRPRMPCEGLLRTFVCYLAPCWAIDDGPHHNGFLPFPQYHWPRNSIITQSGSPQYQFAHL